MTNRFPLSFFVLVFALSLPFWWIGSVSDLQLMPGLSVSILMTFCPMTAALILIHRESGWVGVQTLLKRSFDFQRIADKRWYLPVLLLMPLISVGVYTLMLWFDLPLPSAQATQQQSILQALGSLPLGSALLMFGAFFVGALGEELGWSGYLLRPLQEKRSALQAALIVGVVGAAWHVIPLLNMHRPLAWIVWWCLYAVAARILIVWLFNNTGGSVFAVALFHATLNLSFMLFPSNGSHFDIRLGGLLTAGVAVIVIALWGPKTLAGYKTWNRKWLPKISLWLGFFVLALALLLAGLRSIATPVFQFPQPKGPHAVGTLTYHWIDASRADIFAADPNARRELMVQVWYPAAASPSTTRAPYMQEADRVMAAFAHIHDKPAVLFSQFKYVMTNAVTAARVSNAQATYPVLILPVGATGFRQMSTFQVEELASQGYIVVAIDQPGAAADVVFPDGHEVIGVPILQLQALVGPSHMPGAVAPLLQGRVLADSSIVPFLMQDVSFALGQLALLNQADPNKILTGRLDLQRMGAFGVSLGGIVAGSACLQEPRIRACLMMDAPMTSDVVAAGLAKPSMWITRDAASMRLERQRSGGWSEVDIDAHQTSMRAVYAGLKAPGYFVQVPGTFHSNFMDIPNWTPLASWLNLAGPIDGQRAHDIINAYSVAFFNRHLSDRQEPLLDGPPKQYLEVLFETRRP